MVEVRDFKKITEQFRGIYRTYLKRMNGKPEDVNMFSHAFITAWVVATNQFVFEVANFHSSSKPVLPSSSDCM